MVVEKWLRRAGVRMSVHPPAPCKRITGGGRGPVCLYRPPHPVYTPHTPVVPYRPLPTSPPQFNQLDDVQVVNTPALHASLGSDKRRTNEQKPPARTPDQMDSAARIPRQPPPSAIYLFVFYNSSVRVDPITVSSGLYSIVPPTGQFLRL